MIQANYGSNCEASCVVSCPPGWEREGDRCYFWSQDSWQEWKDWHDAEETCKNKGGHLASVTNEEIHDYMQRKGIQVWIGGTDVNNMDGTGVWTDCTNWDFSSGWNEGEPNDHWGKDENCIMYKGKWGGGNYGWNDGSCKRKQRFVCSKSTCTGKYIACLHIII